MVKIKVPATTANLGAGYDTLGLALNLYQEVSLKPNASHTKSIEWHNGQKLNLNENLVYYALEKTLSRYNKNDLGYTLVMEETSIPISRGLGSSAAAIVSGIMCANALLDYSMTQEEIIQMACEIEGHPDNVIPAIIGNLTLSYLDKGSVKYSKIIFPEDLALFAFVPSFTTSTEEARQILPKQYSPSDCVFNISRVGLFIHALYSGMYNQLKIALDDRLHQPYRMEMIKNGHSIVKAIEETEALGTFISGSGPTLMSIVSKDHSSVFEQKMKTYLNKLDDNWQLIPIMVDQQGAHYDA